MQKASYMQAKLIADTITGVVAGRAPLADVEFAVPHHLPGDAEPRQILVGRHIGAAAVPGGRGAT